jgi:ribosomal protein L11 methyltransferase
MYSLRLTCLPEEVDALSAELWELGTAGIQEIDASDYVTLIAAFDSADMRRDLLESFRNYPSEWQQHEPIDWVQATQDSWPACEIGRKIFLAPAWSDTPTPPDRLRIIHNPGLASGTGEHPCTQLALEALEKHMCRGMRIADIGTGSGILAIAALQLGARTAVGVDSDLDALTVARENFEMNQMPAMLIAGSADCLATNCFDLTVANINGTVLLSILEDLLRMTASRGSLILAGFQESELPFFRNLFPQAIVSERDEWRCMVETMKGNAD